jgi:hypothetical protein
MFFFVDVLLVVTILAKLRILVKNLRTKHFMKEMMKMKKKMMVKKKRRRKRQRRHILWIQTTDCC